MDIMSPGLNIAGPQCPIVVNSGSTPTSLVWKGLTEFITIGQTQTFSRIAIRGCSLNISKNHSLPLGMLSKCICHRRGLCLCLCCCLFVGSGHVLLSLWSNVSKVKSLKDCSLAVFSKCICHCLCHCLCLRHCLFVGQVMFSHHPDQMSQRSKVSKIALWRYSLNVIVIVFAFVFVFVVVFFLVRLCFFMAPIRFARLEFGLDGWKALNP